MHDTRTPEPENRLRALLDSQPLAVLATVGAGQPHTSLVAFVAGADLRTIVFATARATRKFENLRANASVSLLVDDRTNRDSDVRDAAAVTIRGTAAELLGGERTAAEALYVARHPHLADFVRGADCALIGVRVQGYSLVSRFQQVVEVPVP